MSPSVRSLADLLRAISNSSFVVSFFVALTVTALRFVLQAHIDFDLADEGFLWYGAQRTLVGEVPIRDFMAYDPGRYYWVAGVMSFLNSDGVLALRLSNYLFDLIGLAVGLYLLVSNMQRRDMAYVFMLAVVISLWMYPHNKAFDYSSSIFLIGILAYLVSNPTNKGFFFAGMGLGFIAFIGRNHGVYGLCASLALFVWLYFQQEKHIDLRRVWFWAVGIFIGFSPIFFMSFFHDGFAASFIESIRFLFEFKGTNLPKPVPWPWLASYNPNFVGEYFRDLLIGFAFISLIVFGLGALASVSIFRNRTELLPPVFIASAFLAVPYAHYAFSRADVVHLSQGVFPVLIGVLVLVVKTKPIFRWLFLSVFLVASYWVMHYFQPGTRSYFNGGYIPVAISGDEILVNPREYSYIDRLRNLKMEFVGDGQTAIVTPLSPGAYPLLGLQSPIWEINALFPRSERMQMLEVERIRNSNVGLVIVEDIAIDGREDLRFRNTHPIIYKYIMDNFVFLPSRSTPTQQVFIMQAAGS